MSYTEKAIEFRESAELNWRKGMYNSAVNRFYYCLFISAKDILERESFNYKKFLRSSKNLNEKQRNNSVFSHGTIHIALAEHIRYNKKEFIEMWRFIYKLRATADYKNVPITREQMDTCRTMFYEIHRRIVEWTDL